MMRLGVSYTKAINKRFDRTGALFQGQFQAKPVTTYKHLLTLCAYIHANPVKDGLAAAPEMWDFSNYLEWLGLRNGTLVNREFISENFGTPEEYRKFVADYIQNRQVDEEFRKYVEGLELTRPPRFQRPRRSGGGAGGALFLSDSQFERTCLLYTSFVCLSGHNSEGVK